MDFIQSAETTIQDYVRIQITNAPITATATQKIAHGQNSAAHGLRVTHSLNFVIAPLVPGIASVYVIHQQNGNRYTRDGFNSKWRNAKLAAAAANPGLDFNFTFHDLKAKGISDLDGSLSEKQAISGHKNSNQTAIYDRKVKNSASGGKSEKMNTYAAF